MASAARVLVADDEHTLRRLLRLYLEKERYEVVEADDGLRHAADGRRSPAASPLAICETDVVCPTETGIGRRV